MQLSKIGNNFKFSILIINHFSDFVNHAVKHKTLNIKLKTILINILFDSYYQTFNLTSFLISKPLNIFNNVITKKN